MIVIQGDAKDAQLGEMLLMRLAQYECGGKSCAIVCTDENRARSVREWATVLGLEIGEVLTVRDFMTHEFAGGYAESIYVDDGIACLKEAFEGKLKAVTLQDNPDDVKILCKKGTIGETHEEKEHNKRS